MASTSGEVRLLFLSEASITHKSFDKDDDNEIDGDVGEGRGDIAAVAEVNVVVGTVRWLIPDDNGATLGDEEAAEVGGEADDGNELAVDTVDGEDEVTGRAVFVKRGICSFAGFHPSLTAAIRIITPSALKKPAFAHCAICDDSIGPYTSPDDVHLYSHRVPGGIGTNAFSGVVADDKEEDATACVSMGVLIVDLIGVEERGGESVFDGVTNAEAGRFASLRFTVLVTTADVVIGVINVDGVQDGTFLADTGIAVSMLTTGRVAVNEADEDDGEG